ncbi:MAG: DUF4381 domain-containing protein [Alphaproteobacteria bacterium]|nr:DUF4381 domain-containing protein [Alphaproteobacteria bacterium]
MLLPPDLNREELLAYVRPLYPNGIFPLGSGWQIVFYAVLIGVAAGVLFYRSPYMKRRRETFAALNGLRCSFLKDGDVSVLAGDLSVLMRRVALFRFGRERTAGLNGQEWIDFLKQTGADLNEQDQQLLAVRAYAPPFSEQDRTGGKHLLRSVQKWLERNV